MKTPKRLQELLSEIADEFSEATLRFKPLPSGVCMLDAWYGRRNFELDYSPTRGTGVSENFDDTPPFIGHDVAFDSLDEAAQHFKSLLADAVRTEAEHLPKAFVMREENSPWNKK
ncbi:MAG: hypothetical protein M3Y82_07985 [Verrucomicrobiota bacterium]|nr:hypothetical protein [Verrucomicrobiota bacterium]